MNVRAHARQGWLACLLVLVMNVAYAEQWVRTGPGPDAYVRTVRIFTNTPAPGQSTLFLATLGAGVVKLVDNGSTITTSKLVNGLPHHRVRSIAATDVNNLWVVMDQGGLYKSTDGGATWNAANGAGPTRLGCAGTRNFGFRSATEIWLATGCSRNSGVWRTLDGGGSWSRLGAGVLPDDVIAGSFTFNGTGPTTVVTVATARDGLYRSNDNGDTWAQINNGLPAPGGPNRLSAFNVIFGASASEMLVYVEGEGVYRSTDGGANWAAANTGLPANIGSHGGLVRGNATVAYIGTDKGPLYRTADFGLTWSAFGATGAIPQTQYLRGLTFDAVAGKIWFHGAQGLARSLDGGATISEVIIPEGFVAGAQVGSDSTALYLAAGSVYKVPNLYAGTFETATDIGAGVTGAVNTVVVDHSGSGILYAPISSSGRIAKTMTDGASWFTYPQSFAKGSTPVLEPSLSDPNVVYMGQDNKYDSVTGGGFWKSVDGGQSWTAFSTGLATAAARQVNAIGQTTVAGVLYLATDDGVYKSTNQGNSWTRVLQVLDTASTPLPFNAVRVDPNNDAIVWTSAIHLDPDGTVLASSGIYKSTDGGATWTQKYNSKRAHAVRPESSGRVVAGLNRSLGDPVFVASIDGGNTWQPFINGTTTQDSAGLARNKPHTGGFLTIGLTASGTYFLAKPLLTLASNGKGSVTASADGTLVACSSCSPEFHDYQLVSVTPQPQAGQSFISWAGACTGSGACQVRMDQSKSVIANFTNLKALQSNIAGANFGGQSMNTTSINFLNLVLTNISGSPVTVTSVVPPAHFPLSANNCVTTIPASGTCQMTVNFKPTAEGGIGPSDLQVNYADGPTLVSLSGTGERSLVTHYYGAILRRAPDAGGKAFWLSEASRVAGLGANVNETWYSMATSFFFSGEYLAFNRDNGGFVTDLYNTFFNRAPDSGGLAFWVGRLDAGMPREVVLVSFMFSSEFTTFTQAIFGNTAARAEVDVVMDFYRGLLSRLPDNGGFANWVNGFRSAQCQGGSAVYAMVEQISSGFATSGEYVGRNRSNAQYVGDLYNAFLRRGGDLAGVQYWINELNTNARTREQVRQAFISTPEFTNRANAILSQGCIN